MKLNVKAFTVTSTVFFRALSFLMVGITNLVWSGYGSTFLQVVASIYPGYHAETCVRDIAVGTLYALVDGAFCLHLQPGRRGQGKPCMRSRRGPRFTDDNGE